MGESIICTMLLVFNWFLTVVSLGVNVKNSSNSSSTKTCSNSSTSKIKR